MKESFIRLHKNVQHINHGAVHPLHELHERNETRVEEQTEHSARAGCEMYHRFYGKKMP